MVTPAHERGISIGWLPKAFGLIVRTAVDRLPDFLRHVVILAYYQGLKYKDVAEILSIPVGTVKSRLSRGLGRLREVIDDE